MTKPAKTAAKPAKTQTKTGKHADKPFEPRCGICGEPLCDHTWVDDDRYGEVHVKCLENEVKE